MRITGGSDRGAETVQPKGNSFMKLAGDPKKGVAGGKMAHALRSGLFLHKGSRTRLTIKRRVVQRAISRWYVRVNWIFTGTSVTPRRASVLSLADTGTMLRC